MILETKQEFFLMPLDVQTEFKQAERLRKRNALKSRRFRQRRKAKKQEISEKISNPAAQVREMTEEKEYYLQERDVQPHTHTTSAPIIKAKKTRFLFWVHVIDAIRRKATKSAISFNTKLFQAMESH